MLGLDLAQDEGFSEAIIDRFFRPFLGGIFFDTGKLRDRACSSRIVCCHHTVPRGCCCMMLTFFMGSEFCNLVLSLNSLLQVV